MIARRMADQGVHVKLELYRGMPHDFLVLLPFSSCGQECLDSWSAFVKDATARPASSALDKENHAEAVIRDQYGRRQAMDIADIGGSQRKMEELIQGMQDTILGWGRPWTRSGEGF